MQHMNKPVIDIIQDMKEEYKNSKDHISYDSLERKIVARKNILDVLIDFDAIWYDNLSWDQQVYYNNLLFHLLK